MRILVVDDDYVSRTKLKKLLNEFGDCDVAPDGEIALKMFEKSHEESVPYALISLDIAMPGMQGQDVLKKIREYESRQKVEEEDWVKVLMVTVKNEIKSVSTSYYEGCEGYLVKPVNREKLEDALKEMKFI